MGGAPRLEAQERHSNPRQLPGHAWRQLRSQSARSEPGEPAQ